MFALLLLIYRIEEQRAFKHAGHITPAAQKRPSLEVNALHPKLQFTAEAEKDHNLNYLDISIQRTPHKH